MIDSKDVAAEGVPKPSTRGDLADAMARSANRMQSFIALKAPEIVIENERRIMLRLVFDFPVNSDSQQSARETDAYIRHKEFEALAEAGYYDDEGGPT